MVSRRRGHQCVTITYPCCTDILRYHLPVIDPCVPGSNCYAPGHLFKSFLILLGVDEGEGTSSVEYVCRFWRYRTFQAF